MVESLYKVITESTQPGRIKIFRYRRSKVTSEIQLYYKVKSWRDAGDTPGRKNHQEEANLRLLHIPSWHIASPLHGKWRNQEGSHTTRCHLLLAREMQTTR
jgi:hypothetical protein